MSDRAHHFKIGLFVIGTLALLVTGVTLFGAGAMFEEKYLIETYMDQSVQGLEVGSPVRFLGVRVGSVQSIQIAAVAYREQYEQLSAERRMEMARLVVVVMAITHRGAFDDTEIARSEARDSAIQSGLRARLSSQGITGVMYVELDFLDPAAFPASGPPWETERALLPSAPSTVKGLVDTVQAILTKIESLEIQRLLSTVEEAVAALKQELDAIHVEDAISEAQQLLGSVRTTVDEVSPRLVGAVERAEKMLDHLDSGTLANIDQAARRIDSVVARIGDVVGPENESLRAELRATMTNLRTATESIPGLIDGFNRTMQRLDRLATGPTNELPTILEDLQSFSRDLRELGEVAKAYPSLLLLGKQPDPIDRGK